MQEGAGTGARQADVNIIQRQISNIDSAIEARTPGKISGTEKDRLAKEEKELEDSISQGMPTRDEMRYPSRNPGAVRKHLSWSQRNQADIERYRYIQRTLRPGEPKSIENLRRDK